MSFLSYIYEQIKRLFAVSSECSPTLTFETLCIMLVILNFDEKLQVFQFSKFSNFYYIGFSGKAYKFSNASVHLFGRNFSNSKYHAHVFQNWFTNDLDLTHNRHLQFRLISGEGTCKKNRYFMVRLTITVDPTPSHPHL